MNNMFDLSGKVALVTGASYGIGYAIASALAGAGAKIVFNDINEELVNKNDYDENNGQDFGGNFKFWRGYSFKFNATLNALLAKGKAKILATPSIITIPGKEASIFIGDHIPVQTEKHNSTGSYTTTEYLDA
mgnify:CR=1 FL=1